MSREHISRLIWSPSILWVLFHFRQDILRPEHWHPGSAATTRKKNQTERSRNLRYKKHGSHGRNKTQQARTVHNPPAKTEKMRQTFVWGSWRNCRGTTKHTENCWNNLRNQRKMLQLCSVRTPKQTGAGTSMVRNERPLSKWACLRLSTSSSQETKQNPVNDNMWRLLFLSYYLVIIIVILIDASCLFLATVVYRHARTRRRANDCKVNINMQPAWLKCHNTTSSVHQVYVE